MLTAGGFVNMQMKYGGDEFSGPRQTNTEHSIQRFFQVNLAAFLTFVELAGKILPSLGKFLYVMHFFDNLKSFEINSRK